MDTITGHDGTRWIYIDEVLLEGGSRPLRDLWGSSTLGAMAAMRARLRGRESVLLPLSMDRTSDEAMRPWQAAVVRPWSTNTRPIVLRPKPLEWVVDYRDFLGDAASYPPATTRSATAVGAAPWLRIQPHR